MKGRREADGGEGYGKGRPKGSDGGVGVVVQMCLRGVLLWFSSSG